MHRFCRFLLVALFVMVPLTEALAQESVGSITAGAGEIVVIRPDGAEVPGGVGTEIQQYDTIYVAEGGEATVTFVDQTILALSGGSALTIDELVYDPAGQANVGLFTLAGGLMGLVSGDIVKTGDMSVTTPVSTIGIRGTAVLVDSGTRIWLDTDTGDFVINTTSDDGELVTLILSPDGYLGVVGVINTATGAGTVLSTFGESVRTSVRNGGAVQVKSTLTAAAILAQFGPVLRALEAATGLDLGDPANAAEAEALRQALQDLFDTIEENPAQDASPD